MRIWFKMMKNNHLLRDTTITDESLSLIHI